MASHLHSCDTWDLVWDQSHLVQEFHSWHSFPVTAGMHGERSVQSSNKFHASSPRRVCYAQVKKGLYIWQRQKLPKSSKRAAPETCTLLIQRRIFEPIQCERRPNILWEWLWLSLTNQGASLEEKTPPPIKPGLFFLQDFRSVCPIPEESLTLRGVKNRYVSHLSSLKDPLQPWACAWASLASFLLLSEMYEPTQLKWHHWSKTQKPLWLARNAFEQV